MEETFEAMPSMEKVFELLVASVLEKIKEKYGEDSSEFLAYHNHEHTKHMLDQVNKLADLLKVSEETKAKVLVATLFHDYVFNSGIDNEEGIEIGKRQMAMRVRSSDPSNETNSAVEMSRILAQFNLGDEALSEITEMILVTNANFQLVMAEDGEQYGTFVQPRLFADSPIGHFMIALPDLNLCGSEEFTDFLEQGNRVFRERYIGIGQTISMSEDKEKLDFWAKKMRTWAIGQVSFVKGRQIDFENKVKAIEDRGIFTKEQHEALLQYYQRFGENITSMERLAEDYKSMPQKELFSGFGYHVIE